MLKDVSRIKISGGCEAYAEGCITFVPLDKDKVKLQVDNSGHYFYGDNSELIPSFEIEDRLEHLSAFIENWIELMDSIEKSDCISTENAFVSFDFSLQNGTLHASYSEHPDGYQLDPIIDSIVAFVAACHKKANPPALAAKPSFAPLNQTEEFLGSPAEREKAVLQFNDLHGLHGGKLIVVTGAGNVLVQLVSYNSEKNKMWEQRYLFDISPAQLDEIFNEVINNDVMTIQLKNRTGVPDETRIHFTMTNANNDFFKLEAWEKSSLSPGDCQNNPRAKFDRACLKLKQLEQLAKTENTPVQEGPYSSELK